MNMTSSFGSTHTFLCHFLRGLVCAHPLLLLANTCDEAVGPLAKCPLPSAPFTPTYLCPPVCFACLTSKAFHQVLSNGEAGGLYREASMTSPGLSNPHSAYREKSQPAKVASNTSFETSQVERRGPVEEASGQKCLLTHTRPSVPLPKHVLKTWVQSCGWKLQKTHSLGGQGDADSTSGPGRTRPGLSGMFKMQRWNDESPAGTAAMGPAIGA